jgi:hypothetical protein
MSGDGLAFAGTSIDPQGQEEAWTAVVPEPSFAVLIMLRGVPCCRDGGGDPRRCSGVGEIFGFRFGIGISKE